MKTVISIKLIFPEEAGSYLAESAYARRISRTQLLRMAVDILLKDKLLDGVLDDDRKPSAKTRRKRPRAKYNPKIMAGLSLL